LQSIKATGADTLVLGCTHYPFLLPLIVHQLGSAIKIVDTSEAVVRQLARQLEAYRIPSGTAGKRSVLLLSTADGARLHSMAQQLLRSNLSPMDIDFKTVASDLSTACH
jgi:glutamate racemase